MRGDRTIRAGEDAKAIREKKLQAQIDLIKQEALTKYVPAGYCGICSTHYKGNYTKHECKT
jgi:hypothetical protein